MIIQSPNFFGVLEDAGAAAETAHKAGTLLVGRVREAVALGLIEPPKDADIVAGELQSFAISPSFGGPYAGVMAAKEKYMRQMPGRLVGQTEDSRGNRAFCLTLATREQHIRREKATSNICTNQALIALMARCYVGLRQRGLARTGRAESIKAHYMASKLTPRDSAARSSTSLWRTMEDPAALNDALLGKKIIGGLAAQALLSGTRGMRCCCAHRDATAASRWTRWRTRSWRGQLIREKKSSAAHQSERAADLRDQFARQEGLSASGAGRSRGGCRHRLGAANVRAEIEGFPEVSEVEAIRHFTRLSTWNYAIDLGMYPLGSCTMKYNPRVNEAGGADRRAGVGASLSAGIAVAGGYGGRWRNWKRAARNHRHGCCHAAARRRRAWRIHRHSADSRAARIARQSAQENAHSGFGAWHQSGDRGHGGLRGAEHQIKRARA